MKKLNYFLFASVISLIMLVCYTTNDRLDLLTEINVEALAQDESSTILPKYEMKRVLKQIQITGSVNVGMTINGTTITLGDIQAGFYAAWISCCMPTEDETKRCPFEYQNKDC